MEMKSNLKLIAVVALVGLLSACSSGPRSVVEDTYQAINAANYDEVIKHLDPQMVAALGKPKVVSMFSERHNVWAAAGGLKSEDLLSEKQTGDSYTSTYTLHFGNGGVLTDKNALTKVDGKWYFND
jgi:hypothetical protein